MERSRGFVQRPWLSAAVETRRDCRAALPDEILGGNDEQYDFDKDGQDDPAPFMIVLAAVPVGLFMWLPRRSTHPALPWEGRLKFL